VIDKYRVISIDGLDDPDVRDSRDENPADDGEQPNFSLYGGRTIAITGRIEAYSLAKLRDMQQALRTAFVDISRERRFNFLTGASETDHYINCKKFTKNQWGEEQKHLNHFFRDFVITLRASDPRFYLKSRKDYSVFPNKIENYGFEEGVETGWFGGGTGWTVNVAEPSETWSSEGDWSEEIDITKDANTTPRTFLIINTTDYGVTVGEEYEFLGDVNVIGAADDGIYATIVWLDNVDATISTSNGTAYTGTGVKTISLTATAPALAVSARMGWTIASNVSADNVHLYLDNAWFGLVGTNSPGGRVKVTNSGNFKASPTFKIYGQIEAPAILNETTGKEFAFKSTTTIANGDYYVVDMTKKTIVDSSGNNKFNELDPSSDWITIEPGDNWLQLKNQSIGLTEAASLEIQFRDAWI
jgi:hypothetical protein